MKAFFNTESSLDSTSSPRSYHTTQTSCEREGELLLYEKDILSPFFLAVESEIKVEQDTRAIHTHKS